MTRFNRIVCVSRYHSRRILPLLLGGFLLMVFAGTLPLRAQQNRGTGSISQAKKGTATRSSQGQKNLATARLTSVAKNARKKGYQPSPRAQRQAVEYAKNRKPENPVRFVLSSGQSNELLNPNPSAGAIWSTLLSGNMSNEIIRWHVRQRQLMQDIQVAERENPAAAERMREELRNERLSDYDRMIARTHFSLTPADYEDPLDSPSNGAIVARFLTGKSNREMSNWKEQRVEDLIAMRQEQKTPAEPFDTSPAPMYANLPAQVPAKDLYAFNSDYAALEQFRPAGNVEPSLAQTTRDNRASEIARSQHASRPLMNDGLPVNPIRPVEWVTREESRPASATTRVYQTGTQRQGTKRAPVAQPLPISLEDDSDQWSPLEPK